MVNIRKAERKDTRFITRIETKSFSVPETEESISSFINNKHFTVKVIENDGYICGHCIYFTVPNDLEIISIAVAPDKRGNGYGKALLEDIINTATETGIDNIFLEVRKSNNAAIAMYENSGFFAVGERPNFYDKPVEDGIIMRYSVKK